MFRTIDRRMLGAAAVAALMLHAAPGFAADEGKPKSLTILAGPTGSSFYATAAGVAAILGDEGVRANAEMGGGTSNVVGVSRGTGELGLTMSIVPSVAAAGKPPFQEPITNVRGIASFTSMLAHIAVAGDSGVQSIGDLAGKRFASQPVGQATALIFDDLLAATGTDASKIDIVRGGLSFQTDQIKDHHSVGMISVANYPASFFTELASTSDIRFLTIDDALAAKLQELNPGYARAEIPAGTYPGQDAAIPTVGTSMMMIASDEMPEDEAYWLTKTLIEKFKRLQGAHAALARLEPADMAAMPGITIHPGALRAYQEAGVLAK
ncbi:TAXI family TRAP transporter solute-binding subunit [Tistrella mobilis]